MQLHVFFPSVPGACEVDGGTPALRVVARCYDSKRQHGHLFTQVRTQRKVFDYNNMRFSFNIQFFREEKGSFEMIRYLLKLHKSHGCGKGKSFCANRSTLVYKHLFFWKNVLERTKMEVTRTFQSAVCKII